MERGKRRREGEAEFPFSFKGERYLGRPLDSAHHVQAALSVEDARGKPAGRLVAARVAALEGAHQAEVNDLRRASRLHHICQKGVLVYVIRTRLSSPFR